VEKQGAKGRFSKRVFVVSFDGHDGQYQVSAFLAQDSLDNATHYALAKCSVLCFEAAGL
jgi:hypothetical protein